jgi:DNA invertase Pin-like site-specific DNA recombinase
MEAPAIPQMHRVGYARVSSVGQNLDSQVDALQKAGCKKTFSDKMTGSRMDRPGWDQLMDYVRPGDALVVTELSRMTRSDQPAGNGTITGLSSQPGLLARKYRYQSATAHCSLSIMAPSTDERAVRARLRAEHRQRRVPGRPRTDVVKLKNAKVFMRIPGKQRTKSAKLLASATDIFLSRKQREMTHTQ